MVIYNHSRYLNIAFWGVVLGELISLAHDFHFTKGLLWKFSAAIPENLGTLISFVCGAILWMYLQQAWANHKVFKTVSISSLIAMEGLFCLFLILADKNWTGRVRVMEQLYRSFLCFSLFCLFGNQPICWYCFDSEE